MDLTTTKAYRRFSRIVRAACNCTGKPYPIAIVEGDDPPGTVGESWHYETKGGRRIYHPSAYSKRGWSNMVYCGSTKAIEVGRAWLAVNGLADWEEAARTELAKKELIAAAN